MTGQTTTEGAPVAASFRITEARERDAALIRQLTDVWERSVRATHLFLSEADILRIRERLPEALAGVERLLFVNGAADVPVAFMGIEKHALEMLFLAPEARGRGLGKTLLRHALRRYGVNAVSVNEQNPLARGFYEHCGFEVRHRTPRDGNGDPWPLIHMRLSPRKDR